MDDYAPPLPTKKQTIRKTLSKFLHIRSSNISSSPEQLGSSSTPSTSSTPSLESSRYDTSTSSEAMESLIAELFASVSSIKASYAQFQMAQSPYDAASVQSSDLSIVTELRHVSELKRDICSDNLVLQSPLQSKINEQHNLLKTYEITCKKLESDVGRRDSKLVSLRLELSQLNLKNRELESIAFPGKTLASLDRLHLSGLNPMHFLCALRFAVKSIRNFVNLMVKQMMKAGWDLHSASKSIHPDIVLQDTAHRNFSFESFVCNVMFSEFHKKDFNLKILRARSSWERDKFFNEFTSLKSSTAQNLLETNQNGFKQFLQAKYSTLIHPNMELSFFSNLDHRDSIKTGLKFPNSNWFKSFAEMARRVWLLHCLFFSFEAETKTSIFQLRKGTRFSEVYMDSVVPAQPDRAVGFTVVPGFQIGLTVVQSRVYLSHST
ncbi:hypothetical protein LUZ60_008443 [Juncus effusus]|nr:hypothetical protein LUZ60_008443 [Juncus effusus]